MPSRIGPLRRVAGVREAEASGRFVRCAVAGPVGPLLQVAAADGLVNVISHEPDLEEIFLSYMKGGDGHGAAGIGQDAA